MAQRVRPEILALLMIASLLCPALASAQSDLTAADVVGLSPERDGETVTFSGEAIGDVLRATTGGVWVNALSGGTALGVWMTPEAAAQIQTLGDYKHTGDTLRVTGTFNFACDLHGGDLDVHAESLEVVESGSDRQSAVEWWKLQLAAVLGAFAVVLTIVYRRRPPFA